MKIPHFAARFFSGLVLLFFGASFSTAFASSDWINQCNEAFDSQTRVEPWLKSELARNPRLKEYTLDISGKTYQIVAVKKLVTDLGIEVVDQKFFSNQQTFVIRVTLKRVDFLELVKRIHKLEKESGFETYARIASGTSDLIELPVSWTAYSNPEMDDIAASNWVDFVSASQGVWPVEHLEIVSFLILEATETTVEKLKKQFPYVMFVKDGQSPLLELID